MSQRPQVSRIIIAIAIVKIIKNCKNCRNCKSKRRYPDRANIWGGHCLIWFWGSLWVACIRVWEESHTCNATPRIDIRVYEHLYTCIRASVYGYTCVYTSTHTCRGTRHRASTDVTPQLPSDLLLPNLGSSLLNHLHRVCSGCTAAFIAAIKEICELDRVPTMGRVSPFFLHYLSLVLFEGSVLKNSKKKLSTYVSWIYTLPQGLTFRSPTVQAYFIFVIPFTQAGFLNLKYYTQRTIR